MKAGTKWILVALVVIGLSVTAALLPVKGYVQAFQDWVHDLGALGIVLFILVYALAAVLFVPGWIFTVSAGFIYGITGGTLVALSGAVIGSSLSFLIARYFLRSNIEEFARKSPRFGAIDQAIGKEGWKIIGLLRLSPLIPFNLSNYFYGITSVRFGAYVLVSALCMIPGTLLYAYLGAIGQAGLSGGHGSRRVWQYLLLGLGLVATIAVTILVSRIAKNALKKAGAVE